MPSESKPTGACELSHEQLSAYLDGVLSADERRKVAAHLDGCAACSDMLADYGRIGRSLRQHGRTAAPPALAARVRHALDRVEADDQHPVSAPPVGIGSLTSSIARPRGFVAQIAALAATCLVSVLTTWWVMTSSGQSTALERDLLNAHLRSMLQDNQVQIASSDQHTVRPWFVGRADFAPAVKDLATDGFPLVGGRLDYVADRRSGVLVYKRRLHVINVFMWPASAAAAESAPRPANRNGYNLLTWTRNGIVYAAVSDLNRDELRTLQELL
jgi:anti-sigma factor RsiW